MSTEINAATVMLQKFEPDFYTCFAFETGIIENGDNAGEAFAKMFIQPRDLTPYNLAETHTLMIYDQKGRAPLVEKIEKMYNDWVAAGEKTTDKKLDGLFFNIRGKQFTCPMPAFKLMLPNGSISGVLTQMKKFVGLKADGFCEENPFVACARVINSRIASNDGSCWVDDEDVTAQNVDPKAPETAPDPKEAKRKAMRAAGMSEAEIALALGE